jgi:hypothetical protein
MKSDFWLEQIPLWGVFILTVIMVLLSIGAGVFMGDRRRRQPDHEAESSLGTIITATLGLLAFMLAFTFGMAANRLETRKQLLLDEINAIGTTYLRAGYLLKPHSSEIRKLLREYAWIWSKSTYSCSRKNFVKLLGVQNRCKTRYGHTQKPWLGLTAVPLLTLYSLIHSTR